MFILLLKRTGTAFLDDKKNQHRLYETKVRDRIAFIDHQREPGLLFLDFQREPELLFWVNKVN
jgi:hypothetical protein